MNEKFTDIKIPEQSELGIQIRYERLKRDERLMGDMLHKHSEYEMLVNIKGDEHVVVEKQIYPITHGDVILVYPEELHHCVFNSENENALFWLLIDAKPGSFVAELLDGLKKNYFSTDAEAREQIISLCTELLKSADNKAEALRALLGILCILQKARDINADSLGGLPKELSDVLYYMDEHISEEIRISEVAKQLGFSSSTILRRFIEFLGVTPHEYLKKKRMIKAAELLKSGNSVLDAGLAVGYSDNSHFIKIFKSFYGVTPLKYKSEVY